MRHTSLINTIHQHSAWSDPISKDGTFKHLYIGSLKNTIKEKHGKMGQDVHLETSHD
jgi:hypothetical protein